MSKNALRIFFSHSKNHFDFRCINSVDDTVTHRYTMGIIKKTLCKHYKIHIAILCNMRKA